MYLIGIHTKPTKFEGSKKLFNSPNKNNYNASPSSTITSSCGSHDSKRLSGNYLINLSFYVFVNN